MFFISKYCCVSILHVFSVYGLPSFVPILCNEVNFHYLAQMDSRSSYCLSLNAVRLREVGGYHYKRSAGGIKWQGLLTAPTEAQETATSIGHRSQVKQR